ncbi:hypothetical protein [Pantoea phage Nafs113]|nr:hypothetical protein [Pantoea phage Nafs113]
MSKKRTVMFAVKLDITQMQDAKITPCHIHLSTKKEWIIYTLGEEGGRKIKLNKHKFIIFGSLLGANAHIVAAAEKHIERLEQVIDDWYDVAEQHRMPLQVVKSEEQPC